MFHNIQNFLPIYILWVCTLHISPTIAISKGEAIEELLLLEHIIEYEMQLAAQASRNPDISSIELYNKILYLEDQLDLLEDVGEDEDLPAEIDHDVISVLEEYDSWKNIPRPWGNTAQMDNDLFSDASSLSRADTKMSLNQSPTKQGSGSGGSMQISPDKSSKGNPYPNINEVPQINFRSLSANYESPDDPKLVNNVGKVKGQNLNDRFETEDLGEFQPKFNNKAKMSDSEYIESQHAAYLRKYPGVARIAKEILSPEVAKEFLNQKPDSSEIEEESGEGEHESDSEDNSQFLPGGSDDEDVFYTEYPDEPDFDGDNLYTGNNDDEVERPEGMEVEEEPDNVDQSGEQL